MSNTTPTQSSSPESPGLSSQFYVIDQTSPSWPVLSTQAVRQYEQHLQPQYPAGALMAQAGAASAKWVERHFPRRGPIVIFAGPGNNGGDAYVTARHLQNRGYAVTLIAEADVALPAAAAQARQEWLADGGKISQAAILEQAEINAALPLLIIDGLFGIGLNRPPQGQSAQWIHWMQSVRKTWQVPVLALDLPSGLDADRGNPYGTSCVTADATLTFLSLKPGLLTAAAADYCGQLYLAPLISNPQTDVQPANSRIYLNSKAQFAVHLPQRQANSHKGAHGSVWILGGAPNMEGALLLAGRAAVFAGAGKVYVDCLADQLSDSPNGASRPRSMNLAQPVEYQQIANLQLRLAQPELLGLSSQLLQPTDGSPATQPGLGNAASLPFINALALGPGLGQSAAAQRCLQQVLDYFQQATRLPAPPVIFDADALNLLAHQARLSQQASEPTSASEFMQAYQRYPASKILTPHPLEAARLLGCEVATVQADRLTAARLLAQKYAAWVILKGSGSVIAASDGSIWLNPTGNASLATAGTGDVLTGLLSALLAQGMAPRYAIPAAVWIHGAAADLAAAQSAAPLPAQAQWSVRPIFLGLSASELIPLIRNVLNQLLQSSSTAR